MHSTAILIMFLTVVSKIFGFARDIVLSYFYGVSNITDAYLISLTIPLVLAGFLGAGISAGYIPMYSKIESQDGIEEGNRFTNNLINILFIIYTIVVILGLIFTSEIIKVFASGFKGETLALTVRFTRISLVGVYISSYMYVFNGFLQIKGNYTIPVLIALPMNILLILSIYISTKTDIMVLAYGSVAALGCQLVVLLLFMYKKGYRYKFTLNFRDEHINKIALIALPMMIGVSVDQVNILVDRTIASQLVVGGVSALNYANRLNLFVQGIFVIPITTALFPMISKMVVENNIAGLKKSVEEAISGINLFVIPTTIGAMVFAQPIISLLFGRGAFDNNAIAMTSNALFFYSIGMLGFGLREVLARTFYSLQDTKTPMINSAIAMGTNIILNIILSRFLGLGGLALATSISGIFCMTLLFMSLRKKIGSFGLKYISISFIKILFASLIMGLAARITFSTLLMSFSTNISLLLSIGAGAVVYFIIISFMKLEEIDKVKSILKLKIRRPRTTG